MNVVTTRVVAPLPYLQALLAPYEPLCEQKLNGQGPSRDYLSNPFVQPAHSVDTLHHPPPPVIDKPGSDL